MIVIKPTDPHVIAPHGADARVIILNGMDAQVAALSPEDARVTLVTCRKWWGCVRYAYRSFNTKDKDSKIEVVVQQLLACVKTKALDIGPKQST